MKGFFLKWREVFNEHKVLFFVDLFFIIGVLVVAVSQFFNENYYDVFLCFITFIMFLIPPMVSRHSKVYLPDALQIIIVIFIFSAQILGRLSTFCTTTTVFLFRSHRCLWRCSDSAFR